MISIPITITIATQLIIAYYDKLWIIFSTAYAITFAFFIFQILELWRIRRCLNCQFKQKKQNIRNKNAVNLAQTKENGILYVQSSSIQQQFFQRVHKIIQFFSYFPRTPKSLKSQKKSNFFKSTRFDTSKKHDQRLDMQLQSQQNHQQTQISQKDHKIKLSFITMLMIKQVRQLILECIYGVLIITSVFGILNYHNNRKIEIFQKLTTKQYFIFFIPLCINTAWKIQRVYLYFGKKYNIKTINHQKLDQRKQQIKQSQSDFWQSELILLLQMINIEYTTELMVFLYCLLQCSIQIVLTTYNLLMRLLQLTVQSLNFCYFNYYLNQCPETELYHYQKISDTQFSKFIKFAMNRSLIIVLFTSYLLIRDWSTAGKKVSLRIALWSFHCYIDKIIKQISTPLRKKYQKKIFKLLNKLKSLKIINQHQQSCHKKQQEDQLHISTYYQCL